MTKELKTTKVRLSTESKFLLSVGILFTIGNSIAATFITLFLVRLSGNDIVPALLQAMTNVVVLLISYIIGRNYLLTRYNIISILRTGIIFTIIFYLVILILQERAAPFIAVLGVFSGIGQGFYWLSVNLLVGQVVKEYERGKYFSFQQTFGFLFSIIIPIVSGIVIASFSELAGYYVLFTIAIIMFIASAFALKYVKGFKIEEKLNIVNVLKSKGNKYWSTNKWLWFKTSMFVVINTQIFIVFAFMIFGNEFYIGVLGSIMAAIGVVSSIWFANKININNQKFFYLLVSIVLLGLFITLAIFPSTAILILAYLVLGVVSNWQMTMNQSLKYKLSSQITEHFKQEDYLVAVEFPIATGRIVGLSTALILVSITEPFYAFRILFVILSLIPMASYLVISKKIDWFKKEVISDNIK